MTLIYTDAEAALQSWINAQTALVGAGRPLAKGAVLQQLRGAAVASYVLLGLVGNAVGFGAENGTQVARIGGQVYGPSKEMAALAAVAYADALATGLAGGRSAVANALLLVVDNISGPLWAPDGGEPRYLVDCDLVLQPA